MRPRGRAGGCVGAGGGGGSQREWGRQMAAVADVSCLALPHADPEPWRQQLLSTAVAVGCSVLGAAAAFLLIRHAPSAA